MASATEEGTRETEPLSKQQDEGEEKDTPTSCLYTILGYVAGIMDAVTLAAGLMCAQALGGKVPPFELNGWRYTAQFIVVVPVLIFKRLNVFLERQNIVWVLLVAFSSVLFNVSYYTASNYLPVGTVGGVGPSLVILICTFLTGVLDRKGSYSHVIACTVCVAGVLLVSQPPFLFKESEPIIYRPLCGPHEALTDNTSFTLDLFQTKNGIVNISSNNSSNRQSELVSLEIGYLCLLGSAVGASIQIFVLNRKLGDVNAFVISFWVSVAGTLSQFIIMAVVEKPVFPEKLTCIGLLFTHASCTGVGYVLASFSIQLIMPAVFSLLRSLEVPILFGAQYTVLRTIYPGKENWMEYLGAVLVLFGNVVNPAMELLSHRRQSYKQMN